MVKSLNFNNLKKQYLTVTLPDEKKTVLMIGTPTKKLMSELVTLQGTLDDMQEDGEKLGVLYETCSKIMSRNKTNTPVKKEYLEELLDFEDVMVFFTSYMKFVEEINQRKN